ncbi:MAG: hypothetical protein JSS32_06795 [Verrucomicrobia bacterium]|nr:hypothetical protein [Verrucomicrobiota bacterium]
MSVYSISIHSNNLEINSNDIPSFGIADLNLFQHISQETAPLQFDWKGKIETLNQISQRLEKKEENKPINRTMALTIGIMKTVLIAAIIGTFFFNPFGGVALIAGFLLFNIGSYIAYTQLMKRDGLQPPNLGYAIGVAPLVGSLFLIISLVSRQRFLAKTCQSLQKEIGETASKFQQIYPSLQQGLQKKLKELEAMSTFMDQSQSKSSNQTAANLKENLRQEKIEAANALNELEKAQILVSRLSQPK